MHVCTHALTHTHRIKSQSVKFKTLVLFFLSITAVVFVVLDFEWIDCALDLHPSIHPPYCFFFVSTSHHFPIQSDWANSILYRQKTATLTFLCVVWLSAVVLALQLEKIIHSFQTRALHNTLSKLLGSRFLTDWMCILCWICKPGAFSAT